MRGQSWDCTERYYGTDSDWSRERMRTSLWSYAGEEAMISDHAYHRFKTTNMLVAKTLSTRRKEAKDPCSDR